MAKFVFKLQPVLDHRKRLEDQRRQELGKRLQEQALMENKLREVQQAISMGKSNLAGGMVGRVDVSQIRRLAAYGGQLSMRAQELMMRLYGIHRQVNQARELLIEATQARQAVELLRDKQYKQWQREQDRIEQRAMDEMAAQAFIRRVKEESS